MKLINQLEKIGLNKKQAEVYLACLEIGLSTVQSISQNTTIKRTTVYDILDHLIKQNLVTQTIKGKKRFYIAENPETFKINLQQKEKEFDQILPELKSLHFITGTKPKIKFYEGVEGIKKVLEETLQSKENELKSIIPIKDLISLVGEDYFDQYTQKRISKGYKLFSIRPRSKELKKTVKKFEWGSSKQHNREVRYAPKDFNFSMSMYLFDNKVIFISSKKENFGMIIESEELAYNQKAMFNILWEVSKTK
ncbi:MAG: helix-turn-helix domain-containing protein [bacterium]|nr:helix-turn-helix domain-containing protein [bacterium]